MLLSFFTALFCVAVLGIVTVTTLVYVFSGRRPEARFTLVASLLLIAGLFAFSPFVFIAHNPELRAGFEKRVRAYVSARENIGVTPQEVVQAWIRLYGRDTARAGELTTLGFRKGKTVQKWVKAVQPSLQVISYEHLGGEVQSEEVRENTALMIVRARVAALDGISVQTEMYTLKREAGQWLIDALEVKDEVVPGGKRRHGI